MYIYIYIMIYKYIIYCKHSYHSAVELSAEVNVDTLNFLSFHCHRGFLDGVPIDRGPQNQEPLPLKIMQIVEPSFVSNSW